MAHGKVISPIHAGCALPRHTTHLSSPVTAVSVIIPAYNAETFIGEALASVLAQTAHDFEVIVIDDGSRDRTAQVVQSFPGVRCVQQANAGVSAARNAGAQLAQGRYLAFLDADDLWHPDKLRQQLAAMQTHPEVALSRTPLGPRNWAAGTPSAQAQPPAFHFDDTLAISFLDPYFATSTVMVRADAFRQAGGFDTRLRIAEDVDLYLRVLATSPRVIVMDEALVFKRPVQGSLGDDSAAGYVQLLAVYTRYLQDFPQLQASLGQDVIDRAFLGLHLAHARSLLWAGERRAARQALRQAARFGLTLPMATTLLRSFVPETLKKQLSKLKAGHRAPQGH